MVTRKNRVFILGGGVSGLVVAERILELMDWEVTIFEKNSELGGVTGSFKWGGFDYNDYGPHIWHTPPNSTLDQWKSKFGHLFHEGEFWGHNVLGDPPGKMYSYPISLESINNFPRKLKEKILKELSQRNDKEKANALNFKEYVEALVGPTLTELFFISYPEKLWGVSTSEMTANWAPKRIHLTEKSQQFHRDQWAAVGIRGSGSILQAILDSAISKGLIVKNNSEVTGVSSQGTNITEIIINRNEKIKINKNDRIVSTIPINRLANNLGIKNSLKYRGAHLVYLSIEKDICLPGNSCFLYFSQKNIIFHRVSEQKKFCRAGWPENKTTLVAEIAFNEEDLVYKDDSLLVEKTINGLEQFGFIKKRDILDSMVISLPNVYPLLTREKEVEISEVKSQILNFEQIYLLGTSGEYHYADVQILYSKGRDLAEKIIDETINNKITQLNNAQNKFDSKKTFFTQKPFIVAEIGLNHGGNLELAKHLMFKAKSIGVEYVKFQTYKTENRVSNAYRMKLYTEEVVDQEESIFDTFKKCEFSKDAWIEIFRYGEELELNVFSTPFDLSSLELLEDIGCPAYKIASMDVNNYELLAAVSETGKPVILSSGMSTIGELELAIHTLKTNALEDFILLHCVSSYPASPDILNLKVIKSLQKTFGVKVGFSDHSIGLAAATIALALGAVCIEKHFTLDRKLEGPDHILSSDILEMEKLINLAKTVPQMLGSGVKKISRQELETSYKFKKTLHARKFINKGEIFNRDNVALKGPNAGIGPEHLSLVLGRAAKFDIREDMPITWEAI